MTFTIPNLLSLLRMGLVPLFIIALIEGEGRRALAIFLLAGVTDLLDGFIARFWHQESPLGAYLDPIADKLLLTSAYVLLAIPSLTTGFAIPIWVTVLVLARDFLIVIVALVLYLAVGMKRFPPALIGKATTAAQVVTVLVVLFSRAYERWTELAWLAVHLTAALTLISGLYYIYRTTRHGESAAGSEQKAER